MCAAKNDNAVVARIIEATVFGINGGYCWESLFEFEAVF